MGIVSIITDFGLDDNYVGVMKAVMLNINPQLEIVDICHNIAAQNVIQAAFLFKNSFRYFPAGTIHLAVVDPGVGSKARKAIIVKTDEYFFVGPDNGVLSPALGQTKIKRIVEIKNRKYFLEPASKTFHARDIFAPVAGFLSKKERLENFGPAINDFKRLDLPQITAKKKELKGAIIYIDRFGNLISNIEKRSFYDFVANDKFKIRFKKKIISDKVNNAYCESKKGGVLSIFGSFDTLEIAVNQGSAKNYFGAKECDTLEIIK